MGWSPKGYTWFSRVRLLHSLAGEWGTGCQRFPRFFCNQLTVLTLISKV